MSEIVMTTQNSPGAVGANLVAFFFSATGQPSYVGNDGIVHTLTDDPGNYANLVVTSNLAMTSNTAANLGAVTMNSPAGRVRAGPGTTSLVVTNALVSNLSHVMAWPSQNDTTGRVTAVTPNAGNFTISLVSPTANMTIDFVVVNAA